MLSVGAKITFFFQNRKGGFALFNGATAQKGSQFFDKNNALPIKHVIYYRTYTVLIRYAPHTLLLKIKSN